MDEAEKAERKVKFFRNKIEVLETNARADQLWYEKYHNEVPALKAQLGEVEGRILRMRELLQKTKQRIYNDNVESLIPPGEGVQEMVCEENAAQLLRDIDAALKE